MDKMSQERYNRSRERNDRISALMGQYMLRGYRMLGSVCEVCGVGGLNSLRYFRIQETVCKDERHVCQCQCYIAKFYVFVLHVVI